MSRISMPVLGVQIDALYHCNIEAFGVEYWYSSSGIQATPARSFTHIHGMQPIDNIVYDTTKLKISKVCITLNLSLPQPHPVLALTRHIDIYPLLISPTPSNIYPFKYLLPSSNT